MRDDRFERLYAEHAQGLVGFLMYRTGDRALAEDLLADTFERVLRARRHFDPRRGSEKAWIYSIAMNLLRDHIRRDDAHRRALERARPVPSDARDASVLLLDRELVMEAMSVLSDEERKTVALRYGAEMTAPEIAQVTGEKLTTIEGRLYGALRKLRQELK